MSMDMCVDTRLGMCADMDIGIGIDICVVGRDMGDARVALFATSSMVSSISVLCSSNLCWR